jgi:catechol 2,3-dioxygenase-like lactoylglutathione lyase family enzyme
MDDRESLNEQLILEVYVRDIAASTRFYRQLGFEMHRDAGDFVELRWDRALIYLELVPDATEPPSEPVGNVRVLVPDVDRYWRLAQQVGARVIRPIADRDYGLRDFTIAGPDGVGLRFATRLPDAAH